MGNRVILGARGSDKGLFISLNGVDVTNTGLTTPLAFDSRAYTGFVVHAKGEGSIAAPTGMNNSNPFGTSTATISHGLGYTPLYAVRWCYANDLSSGVATKMRSPHAYATESEESDGGEEDGDESTWKEGDSRGVLCSANSSNIVITNHESGTFVYDTDGDLAPNETFGNGANTIYYAYVIFTAKDTTGGAGL